MFLIAFTFRNIVPASHSDSRKSKPEISKPEKSKPEKRKQIKRSSYGSDYSYDKPDFRYSYCPYSCLSILVLIFLFSSETHDFSI